MANPHAPAVDIWLGLDRPKQADSNDGNDAPFEVAFSNLAHAYLQDRAPGLAEFEVGFQLVDRNDDNTKAVGISGYKAGSQWLYAPVFFINGDLKGHELLYIKAQDAFVPLKENWVDYLLSKRPVTLGDGVNRNTRELGVHYPDMFRALQSPHKYASHRGVRWADGERASLRAEADAIRPKLASVRGTGLRAEMPDWAVVAVAALAKHAAAPPAQALLPGVLKAGGVNAVEALYRTFATYPRLKVAFDAAYDPAAIAEALDAVRANPTGTRVKRASRPRPAAVAGSLVDALGRDAAAKRAAVRAKLEVHRFRGFDRTPSILLDDAEKSALVRDGILIKDARSDDEVSDAYAVDVAIACEKKFQTVSDTGVYDVLTNDGGVEKCLVLVGPLGPATRAPWSTVVRLEGARKEWLNIHQSFVYTAAEYKGWADWWEGLPDADDLATDAHYIALGPDGAATLPFEVRKSLGSDDGGGHTYEVRFDDYASKARSATSTGAGLCDLDYGDYDNYSRYRDGERIHLGQKTGTKFRTTRGDVYVPEGYKLLKLRDPSEECEGRSEEPPLLLGNALDIQVGIMRKLSSLRVIPRSGGFVVGDGAHQLADRDALVALVRDHGLRESTAADVLKQAADAGRKGHAEFRVLVKYADPYSGQPGGQDSPYLTSGGPYAPAMIDPMQGYDDVMGSGVAAQHPLEESVRVDDLKADPRNRDAYDPANPDPMATQVAQDGADKGQKEVFDTAMVGNLLKMTRDDQMVDEHIDDLMKGLDACGRILFVYYWHGEQFAERYGQSDMAELEDSLRNTFESLGDLALFLKMKTVDANPSESAADVDLGDTANQ